MTVEEIKERFDLDYPKKLEMPQEMPWYFKTCFTIDEAARYTGIGQNALRRLASNHRQIVLFNGTKMLLKRKKLEDLLLQEYSI